MVRNWKKARNTQPSVCQSTTLPDASVCSCCVSLCTCVLVKLGNGGPGACLCSQCCQSRKRGARQTCTPETAALASRPTNTDPRRCRTTKTDDAHPHDAHPRPSQSKRACVSVATPPYISSLRPHIQVAEGFIYKSKAPYTSSLRPHIPSSFRPHIQVA